MAGTNYRRYIEGGNVLHMVYGLVKLDVIALHLLGVY